MKVERIWFQTRLRLTQGKVRVHDKKYESSERRQGKVWRDQVQKDARIYRYKADT